jgi:hypothetical protein
MPPPAIPLQGVLFQNARGRTGALAIGGSLAVYVNKEGLRELD